MWQTHHCRHCGQQHIKIKPLGIKKRTKEQVYKFVSEYVSEGEKDGRFTAEGIAHSFKVPTHLIRYALHKLNLEGQVSQKHNVPPHDSTRDRWGGYDSSWVASFYYKL